MIDKKPKRLHKQEEFEPLEKQLRISSIDLICMVLIVLFLGIIIFSMPPMNLLNLI